METRRTNKGGRPALADPAKHRHVLYLNDRENARFLSQWEQSGVTSKSRFIAARLFGEPFRVAADQHQPPAAGPDLRRAAHLGAPGFAARGLKMN